MSLLVRGWLGNVRQSAKRLCLLYYRSGATVCVTGNFLCVRQCLLDGSASCLCANYEPYYNWQIELARERVGGPDNETTAIDCAIESVPTDWETGEYWLERKQLKDSIMEARFKASFDAVCLALHTKWPAKMRRLPFG